MVFLAVIFTFRLRYRRRSLCYRLQFCWHFSSVRNITTRFAHVDTITMITANRITVNRLVSFHLYIRPIKCICNHFFYFKKILKRKCEMSKEEKLTTCHWMIYCTYNMLNIFRALLCPSSGARDYMCVITAYGVQWLFAGCRGSGAEQQRKRDVSRLSSCNIPLPGHTACCPAPDPRQPATNHCTP